MNYLKATLQLLQSKVAKKGAFGGRVTIGQPMVAPETPAAAIFLRRGSGALLSSTSFQRSREVVLRIYVDVSEPMSPEDAEIALDEMVYDIEEDLRTDLSLGTTGWVILGDVTEDYDYADIAGRPFRIADITMPLEYRA